MRKANAFKERIKSVQEEKTKAIQQDMKLAEDTLEDFYIKFENKLKMGMTPPKFTVIPKVLCEEVNKMLIEQGYYLNCSKDGQTFIYFDKQDYDNGILKNSKQNKDNEDLKNSDEEILSIGFNELLDHICKAYK